MEERGIASLNAVARDTGVTYPTLLALYHGTSAGVTFAVLDKLCRGLKCEVADLIEYRRGR